MSSRQIYERESGTNRGFQNDQRLVIEDVDEVIPEDGERAFCEEDNRSAFTIDEGNVVVGVERERGEQQGKGRGRRRIVGTLVLLVFFGGAGVAGFYLFGNGATRKARVAVNSSGSSNSEVQTEEAMTQEAIKQTGLGGPGVTMSDGSVVRPTALEPSNGTVPGSGLDSTVPVTQMPAINGDLSSTVKSGDPNIAATAASEGGDVKQGAVNKVVSAVVGRNSERSVMLVSDSKPVTDLRAATIKRDGLSDGGRKDASGIALPAFGSMLPVKSLGVLYTLRSGGLVRLELTRDVKGKGWSMPRGTVLVGALRGAEFDRAFISLVGFIDSESGKFVKVSGDLLGSDGGSGIRGKRKKMSSNWSRVLARLGETGLRAVGTLAGSFGRGPIVITDGFSGSSARVTTELGGLLGGGDRNTFVEVAAGSPGYIMITELPESVQGVDALAKLSGREVEERSDAEQPRRATGISERELAELIQSGDTAGIKAALSRMTPEMRRVAELVMSGDLAGR